MVPAARSGFYDCLDVAPRSLFLLKQLTESVVVVLPSIAFFVELMYRLEVSGKTARKSGGGVRMFF